MYWDAAVETLSPEALRDLQLTRLRDTVAQAAKSPFYRERLAQAGVGPQGLQSLEDIRKIPLTTKDDLRAHG